MSFFGEVYLRSTLPFLDAGETQVEALFIAETLRLNDSARALDIGCGHGRHLLALEVLGIRAFGLEHDALSLAEMAPGQRSRCVRGDLYRMPFEAAFDAAWAWYATLLISEDDAVNRRALASAASVLRPGGRLLVHGHNPESQALQPDTQFEGERGGWHIAETTHFDAARGLLRGERVLRSADRTIRGGYTVRCPGRDELVEWGRAAGLSLFGCWGDPRGEALSSTSPDIIVGFERG